MLKKNFIGKWRIISMELWDKDYIDEIETGYIQFDKQGLGSLHFGLVFADIDYQLIKSSEGSRVEFSFVGNDEYDDISGCGFVTKNLDRLYGQLYIHRGDNSSFIAEPFI